jgi:hypothetical protein
MADIKIQLDEPLIEPQKEYPYIHPSSFTCKDEYRTTGIVQTKQLVTRVLLKGKYFRYHDETGEKEFKPTNGEIDLNFILEDLMIQMASMNPESAQQAVAHQVNFYDMIKFLICNIGQINSSLKVVG